MPRTGSTIENFGSKSTGKPQEPIKPIQHDVCHTLHVHEQPKHHPTVVVFAFATADRPAPDQRLRPEYVSVRLLF
jgi:hypothetical protein